ncbi:MAG: EF-hand domain-containing protein [Deltaproteobacteria bacterium]|nr:EF-hand domain-containing protein [Deltaproteobacteria bacterium]
MISGISSSSTASVAEMRQQLFNKIDTNSDGSLDKSEITSMIEENASSMVDTLFGSQDTDQDGLLSSIEFESGMAKLGQEMKGAAGVSGGGAGKAGGPPPPDEVFDTADTNEDGVVSQAELAAVMGQNGEDIGKLFSEVDADGDGAITRAEDEAFRAQMDTKMKTQDETSGAQASGVQAMDFQRQLFTALVEALTSSVGASGESTSVMA